MSVLVISIIMVAMAPVITKRVSDNISVADVKYEGRLFEYNTPNAECEIKEDEDGSKYRECPLDDIPDGVRNINVIAVSAGGGGAGAMLPGYRKNADRYSNAATTSAGINAYQTPNSLYLIRLFPFIKKLNISIASAGGGGGGADIKEFVDEPVKSQAYCNLFDAVYVKTGTSDGICVTKKNLGDLGGFDVTKKATVVRSDNTCVGSNCCWVDITSDGSNCTLTGDYPTCGRIVCSYQAANDICSGYKYKDENEVWSLPTAEEIAKMYSFFEAGSADALALNLCHYSSGGSNYCASRIDGCLLNDGTQYSNCSPGALWSNAGAANVFSGSSSFSALSEKIAAASVRCVLRKMPNRTFIATGGGGASGVRIDISVPNSVVERNLGGFVMLNHSIGIPSGGVKGITSYLRYGIGGQRYPILDGDGRITDYDCYGLEKEFYCFSGSAVDMTGFPRAMDADLSLYTIAEGGISVNDAIAKINSMPYANYAHIYSKDSSNITWGISTQNGIAGDSAQIKNYSSSYLGTGGRGGVEADVVYLPDAICYSDLGKSYYSLSSCNDEHLVSRKTVYSSSSDELKYITKPGENGEGVVNPNADVRGGSGGYGGTYVGGSGGKGTGFVLEEDAITGDVTFVPEYSISDRGYFYYDFLDYYNTSAQGGAGGGGGQFMQLENISINENDQIVVYVGKGGSGGIAGSANIVGSSTYTSGPSINGSTYRTYKIYCNDKAEDGENGGKSGVKIGGMEYSIQGGRAGIAATLRGNTKTSCTSSNNSILANSIAGQKGTISTGDFNDSTRKVLQGEDGGAPSYLNAKMSSRLTGNSILHSSNPSWRHYLFGGVGGVSPINNETPCGGYLSSANIDSVPKITNPAFGQLARSSITGGWDKNPPSCSNLEADGKSLEYISPKELFVNKDYGSAGAGGAGGGWYLDKETKAGSGGNGQNGYVYVYWAKVE